MTDTIKHLKYQIRRLNEQIDAEESSLFNSRTTFEEFQKIKNDLTPMIIFHFNAREGFLIKLTKAL